MTFKEFQHWAWESFGYRVASADGGSGFRVPWMTNSLSFGKPGTGQGHHADYGPVQQRLAIWLRARHLVDEKRIGQWIKAGEHHDTGWLINQGGGIWWTENPEDVAHDLIQTGFIAVRCGVEG